MQKMYQSKLFPMRSWRHFQFFLPSLPVGHFGFKQFVKCVGMVTTYPSIWFLEAFIGAVRHTLPSGVTVIPSVFLSENFNV